MKKDKVINRVPSVFMFSGFVKSIPLEIEEAAMIDGCNPVQTFFRVVLPIMKPTYIPIVIVYLVCQKYIIDGVVSGAVKG